MIITRLCQEDGATPLLEHYIDIITKYIEEITIPAFYGKEIDSEQFLQEYVKQWNNFTTYSFCINRVFKQVDQFMTRHLGGNPETLTLTGINLFKSQVFNKFLKPLTESILSEILKGRNLNQRNLQNNRKQNIALGVQQWLIMKYGQEVQCVKIGNDMKWTGAKNHNFYTSDFESKLLVRMNEFYKQTSTQWK